MPPLLLRIHPTPGSLLRDAGDAANGFRLDGVLLALRQGGIRDDLYRLAGEAGCPGWFDPPICVFRELPERLGGGGARPLDDLERFFLLDRLLQQHGGRIFARLRHRHEFVAPLDELFGELVGEGVTPDRFEAAVATADPPEEWEHERNTALVVVYRRWHAAIASARSGPRGDGRAWLHDVAAAVRNDPGALRDRLAGRGEIRIVGLTDLRGGWRALLDALRTSPAVTKIVMYALDHHLINEGLVVDGIEDAISSETLPVPRVTILHAPDTDREIETVAVRIRRLVERGVAPHRIAVVSRRPRPHLELARTTLERAGVPVTTRRRVGYREIPVIRSLLALFRAAADGWTRHGLVELAAQPYFGNGLDASLLDFLGHRQLIAGLDAWRAAFDQLVDEIQAREADDDEAGDRRHWLPRPERASRARDEFHAFAERVTPLEDAKPLRDWLAWLRGFLVDDPWGMETRLHTIAREALDVARLDLAGWRGLHDLLETWHATITEWGEEDEPLSLGRFMTQLDPVLAGNVTLATPGGRGVQLLEALAAVYRPFDHLFLVGLDAGSFPLTRSPSPLMHPEDRAMLAAAGIPLDAESVWETRERALFTALLAGTGEVTLSHAGFDASGRALLSSVFVEDAAAGAAEETIALHQVWTDGLPLLTREEDAAHALLTARIEAGREAGTLTPWNGRIEDPALRAYLADRYGERYSWSPTQLEEYAVCPWRWFSGRLLRLDRDEEPGQEMDPAVRGTIWHGALERFWARATGHLDETARTGERRLLRHDDLEWVRPMLAGALDDAWAAEAERAWLGAPALRDAARAALRRWLEAYLEWEIQLHEDSYNPRKRTVPRMLRTAADRHEVALPPLTLERDGVRFTYRGVVDRVEVAVDERVPAAHYLAAVDYKSSIYATPGGGGAKAWDDGAVLQIPLYAHALAQLMPDAAIARIEYRAIRQRRQVHTLELVRVTRPHKAPMLEPDPDAAAKMERALASAAAHVARVRDGEYPARYLDSCGCPPFCHAWDICRVAGGPRGKLR